MKTVGAALSSVLLMATEPPYNCDPTGKLDATAGLNQLFADAAATGKTALLNGTFLISSPLYVGTATTTTRSKPVRVAGMGGIVEYAIPPIEQPTLNALRAPTTIIASPSFQGAQMMLVQGPGDAFVLSDFLLQCNSAVQNGLVAQGANKSTFERLMVLAMAEGGTGFTFQSNDAYTGPIGEETLGTRVSQIFAQSYMDNCTGLTYGSDNTNLPINMCYWTFDTVGMPLVDSTGGVGLRLRFADNTSFTQCYFKGGKDATGVQNAIVIQPPTFTKNFPNGVNENFPSGINFFMVTVGGNIAYPPIESWTHAATMNGTIGFYPYMQDNAEPLPPWDPRFVVMTQNGYSWSNLRTNAPTAVAIGTAPVQNTASETPFPITGTLSLPAGCLNTRGTIVRMRASGRYSCAETAGLTIQLRCYLDGVTSGNLLYDSGVVALGTARTNEPWQANVQMLVLNTGTSADVDVSDGFYIVENTSRSFNAGKPGGTGDFDLTVAHTLLWTVQWSQAGATASIMLNTVTVDVAPPGAQPAL
ncbi:MAG: hypothetical protein JO036_04545 [Candidatus Eremiobacteraeota bacterium]|nr:hypothetical protein [Candidatus Eremiobacteraeota bacterium]